MANYFSGKMGEHLSLKYELVFFQFLFHNVTLKIFIPKAVLNEHRIKMAKKIPLHDFSMLYRL